ncbi:MAG: hypothetical protein ABH868_04540 [bacterium]
MFALKLEEMKKQILEDALAKNLISKGQVNALEDDFITNYAKNNGFSEYETLHKVLNATFTIVVRDKASRRKDALSYPNQIPDDILHLWMSDISEDELVAVLKSAIDNGTTFLTEGQKDFNIVVDSLYGVPVSSGGMQGVGDRIKELVLDYRKKLDEAKDEDEKQQLRNELLMMICGFFEVDIS